MAFQNPQQFYDYTYNKAFNTDGAYGAQCWDLFDLFCQKQGVTCSRYCALTGYAGDLYKLRYQYGYDKYFEFFYPKNARRGDWYFSDHHVAMVWDVYSDGKVLLLGQNQSGKKYTTLKTYNLSDALGMMRYKGWIEPMNGWVKSNGKWYFFEEGNKVTGWKKISWSKGTDWFYFMADGVMMADGWLELTYNKKKCWFWFDENGVMATGIKIIRWKGENKVFLFDKDGVMQIGTHEVELTFDSSGILTGGKKL